MNRDPALLDLLQKHFDPHRNVPVYLQLGEIIRQTIERGQLRPGDALPTVRAVAAALNLAPNTVAKTFAALKRDGLTENRAGAGTSVAPSAWVGRLRQRDALRELRVLLEQLLVAGVPPADIQETVLGVLDQRQAP